MRPQSAHFWTKIHGFVLLYPRVAAHLTLHGSKLDRWEKLQIYSPLFHPLIDLKPIVMAA